MALVDPEVQQEMTDMEKRERLLQTYNALCDENFKGVPEISSEEVLQILSHPSEDVRRSVVLVDCRSEDEQAVSRVGRADVHSLNFLFLKNILEQIVICTFGVAFNVDLCLQNWFNLSVTTTLFWSLSFL